MQLVFATSFVSERVIYALSWTLLHSFWQGIVLALAAGLIMLVCRRSKASVRYNLLGIALVLFVIGLVATGTILWQYHITISSSHALEINYPDQVIAQDNEQGVGEGLVSIPWVQSQLNAFIAFIDRHTFLIVAFWMLVLGIKSIRMGLDLYYLRRITLYDTLVPNLYWRNRLEVLAEQLQIQKPVQFLESALVKSPTAIGFFKPMVLVPLGLLSNLPAEQVEAILLHELAHIRRNDYLINFMQCLLEQVFFFNPGLLWVSALIRLERENCCDDIAVSAMQSKTHYINALVAFQEFNLKGSKYALAFAGKQKMPLLARVKRILNHHTYKTLSIMEKISLLASVLLISSLCFFSLHKSQAQSTKENRITSFTNVNVAGNGTAKSPQILFLQDTNGKTYSIKRIDKKVVEMYVNGGKIAADQVNKYDWLLKTVDEQIAKDKAQAELDRQQAERDRRQAERDRAQALKDRDQALQDRDQAKRDAEQAAKDQHQANLDQEQAQRDAHSNQVQAQRDREQAQRDKEQAERDIQQAKLDREQAERDREQAMRDREQAERDREQATRDRIQAEKDQKVLEDIIKEMINDKLIKDKKSLTALKLDEDVFKVNGVKQSVELHKKYQEKFLKIANGYRTYSYRVSGN